MAEDKIVTKKTAAKPAAPTGKTPTTAAGAGTSVAKKTLAKAAAPPAPAPIAKAEATAKPATDAASPAAGKPVTKKVAAKRRDPAPSAIRQNTPGDSPRAQREEQPVSLQHLARVTSEQRLDMIREAAYYKAEKRHFTGGSDAQDWAEAEREIDELLGKARQIYGA